MPDPSSIAKDVTALKATLSRADLAARQVRVLLADAYGMLEGDRRGKEAKAHTLDAAIVDYLALLDGSPRDGIRSRTARLDALLASLSSTLIAASELDDDLLGANAVPGVGSSLSSGGVIKNPVPEVDGVPSSSSVSEHMATSSDPYTALKGRAP